MHRKYLAYSGVSHKITGIILLCTQMCVRMIHCICLCVCVFECGSSCIFFRASKICFRYGTLNMHAFILNGNVNDATHELETVTYRFYVVYNVEISLYNDTVNKSHPELLTISEMWSLFVSRIFCSVLFLSLPLSIYLDIGVLMSRRLHNINWLWAQNLFHVFMCSIK